MLKPRSRSPSVSSVSSASSTASSSSSSDASVRVYPRERHSCTKQYELHRLTKEERRRARAERKLVHRQMKEERKMVKRELKAQRKLERTVHKQQMKLEKMRLKDERRHLKALRRGKTTAVVLVPGVVDGAVARLVAGPGEAASGPPPPYSA